MIFAGSRYEIAIRFAVAWRHGGYASASRLAAVAGTRSHGDVEGNGPAQGVAGDRAVGRLDGDRTSATATARWRSPAIASIVQGTRSGKSVVIALNRADGKEVWSKALGATESNDQGPGPRGTPTVDGDRLYVLTENGDLACLKTDGTEVWQRNILKDFGGRQLRWLISESPLVDGPHVDRHARRPGRRHGQAGQDDRQDRVDGKDLSDPAGYSSIIVADVRRRAHLHDVHRRRRRRRARVGRQADVPLSERRERHRQHHHADLLRQQGVLHVRLRHRRRAASISPRRTARSRRRRSTSRAT